MTLEALPHCTLPFGPFCGPVPATRPMPNPFMDYKLLVTAGPADCPPMGIQTNLLRRISRLWTAC